METERYRSRGKEKQLRKKSNMKNRKEQHYQIVQQEIFNQRYMFVQQIQDGTFGRVVRVYDQHQSDWKAMKIIKSQSRHIHNAILEYGILKNVNAHPIEHPGSNKVVQAYEAFKHKENYCIVFEDLGLSLFDSMKKNNIKGFKISQIQQILKDCLQGLDYIHQLGYTHTDLKPENILFEKKQSKGFQCSYHVKIIDFGGAVSDTDQHTSLINTRQYRAPEVILRNKWTKASDMWCLACVLIELFTGEVLFRPGNDDFYHLALIERVGGPIPFYMIQNCDCITKDFFNDYQLNDSFLKWPQEQTMVENIKLMNTINKIIPDQYLNLRDLITKLLVVEPGKRLTAKEALNHSFIMQKQP